MESTLYEVKKNTLNSNPTLPDFVVRNYPYWANKEINFTLNVLNGPHLENTFNVYTLRRERAYEICEHDKWARFAQHAAEVCSWIRYHGTKRVLVRKHAGFLLSIIGQ